MNKEDKIDVSKLHLAELKYYDKSHSGVELGGALSYAFLLDCGDKYINPLNVGDSYPVFERSPYANFTCDGEPYGSKLWLVDGEDITGPCYVLVKGTLKDDFHSPSISIKQLEDYVLNSSKFFKDRVDVAVNRFRKQPVQLFKILKSDSKDLDLLNQYFLKRDIVFQKVR
jgi:hypothetical protein